MALPFSEAQLRHYKWEERYVKKKREKFYR
jgi:hypothetical protein